MKFECTISKKNFVIEIDLPKNRCTVTSPDYPTSDFTIFHEKSPNVHIFRYKDRLQDFAVMRSEGCDDGDGDFMTRQKKAIYRDLNDGLKKLKDVEVEEQIRQAVCRKLILVLIDLMK